jgi:predicted P-loop ATPase
VAGVAYCATLAICNTWETVLAEPINPDSWLPPPPDSKNSPVVSITGGWEARLLRTKGKPRAELSNVIIALRYAPEWQGVLAHDKSAHRTVARKAPPWAKTRALPFVWTEEDDILTADWAQHQGISIGVLTAGQAVQAVAAENSFHPIRDFLDALPEKWDGESRIHSWLREYLGAIQVGEYTSAIGSRWLIGAVARIMDPGCKNDCALILEGPQGARKSTALRILGEPWFSDDMSDIGSKDAQMQLRGTWIMEWSELDSMGRVDIGRVKAFMARNTDRFRPPYGHRLVELPRECVFAGTTNSDSYLRDDSGARRFWPVRCGLIDTDALRRHRDQLWAEAVIRYRDGAKWWLDRSELEEAARIEQADRYEAGVWDDTIRIWTQHRESVTVEEILSECILMEKSKWTQAHRNHVCRALRSFGWTRRRRGSRGSRDWRWWSPEND